MSFGKSNYYVADNPAPGDPAVPRDYPEGRDYPALPVVFPRPAVKPPIVINTPPPSSCSCQQAQGSGFEQKIKENPLVFIIGALALGYFLAKK